MPLAELRPALEAVLMVADQPLDDATLASAVGYPVPEVARRRSPRWPRSTTSPGVASSCATSPAAGATTPARTFAPVVERFVLDGQQARLTQAALETLAVVAYKQPVSRSRVSAIRGVNVDGVMRTLLTRGLVEEAGTDQETGAHLYRTVELLPGADRRRLARRAARAGAVPARASRTSTTSPRSRLVGSPTPEPEVAADHDG